MNDDDILKRSIDIKKQRSEKLDKMKIDCVQRTIDLLGKKLGCIVENIGKVQREYYWNDSGFGSLDVLRYNGVPYMFRMRLPNDYILAFGNKLYETDHFCLLPKDTPIDDKISYIENCKLFTESRNDKDVQKYEYIYLLQQNLTEIQLNIIYRFVQHSHLLAANTYLNMDVDGGIDWNYWQETMDSVLTDESKGFNKAPTIVKEVKTVYRLKYD
jgi:hypothetical protein